MPQFSSGLSGLKASDRPPLANVGIGCIAPRPIISLYRFPSLLASKRLVDYHVWQRRPGAKSAQYVRSTTLEIINSNTGTASYSDDYLENNAIEPISAANDIVQAGGGGMLRLVAAWDSLASLLPPDTGAGPAAELLLSALKLVLTSSSPESTTRALSLASFLAELAGQGLPLDAEAIAAGVLAEAGTSAGLSPSLVEARVGAGVARLLRDLRRVRALPSRVDLFDDSASLALRELALNFYNVKATAVEVAARLHSLRTAIEGGWPAHELQIAALEALQIYAPMGHALGMGAVSAELEDRCFRILFPTSYERTANWLREETAANAETLEHCKDMLHEAAVSNEEFNSLAGGLKVYGRTKTLFSTLKKLLRLGDVAKGGRSRSEIYDLLGIRAVVIPRDDLPATEAEEAAKKACFIVENLAMQLWESVDGRRKDYISSPKPNGYQSLHCTVMIQSPLQMMLASSNSSTDSEDFSDKGTTLELQIRTQAMHKQAEVGEAAHAAYKGGLDVKQARQLRQWSEALLQRASLAAAAVAVNNTNNNTSSDPATSTSTSSTAAAEGLFHHLDLNGDGYLSSEELQAALTELGAGPGGALAAQQLMLLADENLDGSVSLPEFLEFQKRVGLSGAAFAVDAATVGILEGRSDVNNNNTAINSSTSSPISNDGSDNNSSMTIDILASDASDVDDAMFMSSSSSSTSSRFTALQPLSGAGGRPSQDDGRDINSDYESGRFTPRINNSSSNSPSSLHTWSQNTSTITTNWTDQRRRRRRRRSPDCVPRSFLEGSGSGTSVSSLDEPPSISTIGESSSSSNGSRNGYSNGYTNGSSTSMYQRRLHQHEEDHHEIEEVVTTTATTTTATPLDDAITIAANEETPSPEDPELLTKPERPAWTPAPAFANSFMRLLRPGEAPASNAIWALQFISTGTSTSTVPLLDAAGEELPPLPAAPSVKNDPNATSPNGFIVPNRGPCTLGAVLDRDNDVILDLPTVSGRHLRLEVVPWRSGKSELVSGAGPGGLAAAAATMGSSRLMLTDLGSTNGTWVNRAKVLSHKNTPLLPGDIIFVAEPGIALQVCVLSPEAVSALNMHSSASLDDENDPVGPAVKAALKIAAGLKTMAVSRGIFSSSSTNKGITSSNTADTSPDQIDDSARKFLSEERYQEAYMTLLGGALTHRSSGSIWAQLANIERQRMRKKEPGSTAGTARAFFRAAIERFEADAVIAEGLVELEVACSDGQARAYASWAQLEFDLGNEEPGRRLFEKAVSAAMSHPQGGCAGGAPKLLHTWAKREWKLGNAIGAAKLCDQALQEDPKNAFALTLLATIKVAAGKKQLARSLYQRALASDPKHISAIQGWARLEASLPFSEGLRRARTLFRRALKASPDNVHLLQSWAVAEGNAGNADSARQLLQRCVELDPACVAAWHAWAKLEEESGDVTKGRELYTKALHLKPRSVETLTALGCLERRAGKLKMAQFHLMAALREDPNHAATLSELSLVTEARGLAKEAYEWKKQMQRVNAERAASLSAVQRQVRKNQPKKALD